MKRAIRLRNLVALALGVGMIAATTASVYAQSNPRPQRPPFQDVCCGGPCCVKPK